MPEGGGWLPVETNLIRGLEFSVPPPDLWGGKGG